MTRSRRTLALSALVIVCTASAAHAAFSSAVSANAALASATLSAPASVTAAVGICVQGSSVKVDVSWSASAFAGGYDVLRATVSGGPYSVVGSVGVGATTFTDSGTAFSTTYFYVVRATKYAWQSGTSAQASVTTPRNGCH